MSGPGGAGKGTVIRELVARDPKLWLSRSWTTRARRPSESEDAYTFVDRATFEDRIQAGGFLEHAEILGELYGTPTPDVPPSDDLVLEIDVQGAEQVLERRNDVVTVLLVPPSEQAQAERLRERGDSESHIAARLELAGHEMERGRRFADAIVVNDDVKRAAGEIADIVARARRGEFGPRG